MSEPFVVYNLEGEEIVMHSPHVAAELVKNGVLFEAPPLVVEEEPAPTRQTKRASGKE